MKHVSLTMLFAFALTSVTLAAPGTTAHDRAQFAQLSATAGTWFCVDTPASKAPDVMTVKRQGNFYVTRETGDSPGTMYERWNHTYQVFQQTIVNDDGSVYVVTSKSPSLSRSYWTLVYPSGVKGSVTTTLSGHTYTSVVNYFNDKGKPAQSKSVCTKR